ncbi:hypothetical protein ZWY2020_043391 [Hordeum vulgare]|nr:hypothetical protein ZWY2020_043391 [Hordeum vulgare]
MCLLPLAPPAALIGGKRRYAMRRDRARPMHVTITPGHGARGPLPRRMRAAHSSPCGALSDLMRQDSHRPDMDLMFDYMDRSAINRTKHTGDGAPPPPPLFRYCTTREHLDIEPWSREFKSIKQGSRRVKWTDRVPTAYS